MPELFGKKAVKRTNEKEKDILYRQIGKLQVELEWLKKTQVTCYECSGEKTSEHPTWASQIEYSTAV